MPYPLLEVVVHVRHRATLEQLDSAFQKALKNAMHLHCTILVTR